MKNHYLYLSLFAFLTNIILTSCSKHDTTPIDTTPMPEQWMVSTFAGSGEIGKKDGDSTDAQFSSPAGIDFDSHGNLFVADLQNSNIREITPGRKVNTYAGKDVHD